MPDLPNSRTFSSKYVIVSPNPQTLIAAAEDGIVTRTAPNLAAIAALIAEARTDEEISAALALPATEVQDAIEQMERAGLLTSATRVPAELAAYWELLGLDPCEAAERISAASVRVVRLDGSGCGGFEQALAAVGCPPVETGELTVVIAEDYLDDRLDQLNRDQLQAGKPWMLVRPRGRSGWIGPIVIPGRTACYACLRIWLEQNGWIAGAAVASTAATVATIQSAAANEVVKWFALGRNPNIEACISELDTGTLTVSRHPVLRRPQCRACPPVLSHHTAASQELVSPLTGIVATHGIAYSRPSFAICDARCSRRVRYDIKGRRFRVAPDTVTGKGRTESEARDRCFAEAVERYSAQLHGDEPLIRARYSDLGAAAIHPDAMLLFSGTPPTGAFDEDREYLWVSATALTGASSRFLPAGCCYSGAAEPGLISDSNGCACGSTDGEAMGLALLELIERDAMALWWYNRAPRPSWAFRSVSPAIAELLGVFEARGRSTWVLDLTTDFLVPVCAAISVESDGGQIVAGSAAALDAETAIWKSLAECAASLLGLDNYKGHGRTAAEQAQLRWFRETRLSDAGYLQPTGELCALPRTVPSFDRVIDSVSRQGYEIFAVNLTRPELGIPASRVVAPGLRPWHPRFAPGRLFEIPVKLGWVASATPHAQLNPVPYPF